jgi:ribosomal-protein-alanine N-acetyltransferase
MTLRLEAMGAAGAALMAEIHAEAFPPNQAWGAEALAQMLGLPGHFALIAVAGDEALGFALGQAVTPEAELLTLAVRPGARRQGIGGALLDGVLAEAKQRGAEAIFLEVAEGNAAARALYAGAGAAQVGRRPRYYADGADALVLRLGLAGGD